MTRLLQILVITTVAVSVSGCTLFPKKTKPGRQDGPPLAHVDISKIPNAKPKAEPFSKYGNPKSYVVFGKRYHVMPSNKNYKATGVASWYGTKFHGKKTSSGEDYDMFKMTAAHKTLPIPTYAKVKNLDNGKEIIVKINDRGPFVDDRLIDLSYVAARKLGVYDRGTAHVSVTAIDPKQFYKHTAPVANSQPVTLASNAPVPDLNPTPVPTASAAYIQLGAFKNKGNADQLAAQVNNHISQSPEQWDKLSVSVADPLPNSQLYRVRLGPIYNSRLIESIKSQVASISATRLAVVFD